MESILANSWNKWKIWHGIETSSHGMRKEWLRIVDVHFLNSIGRLKKVRKITDQKIECPSSHVVQRNSLNSAPSKKIAIFFLFLPLPVFVHLYMCATILCFAYVVFVAQRHIIIVVLLPCTDLTIHTINFNSQSFKPESFLHS